MIPTLLAQVRVTIEGDLFEFWTDYPQNRAAIDSLPLKGAVHQYCGGSVRFFRTRPRVGTAVCDHCYLRVSFPDSDAGNSVGSFVNYFAANIGKPV